VQNPHEEPDLTYISLHSLSFEDVR